MKLQKKFKNMDRQKKEKGDKGKRINRRIQKN